MIYSPENTRSATVHDIETKRKIGQVMLIDTGLNEVVVGLTPFRLNHLGEIETETIKFRSIYPLFGGGLYPVAFHCYGLQS